MEVLALFNTTQKSIRDIQSLKQQLDTYMNRLDTLAPQDLKDSVQVVKGDLDAVLNTLYETRNKSNQDMLNYGIKLNDKLAGLYNAASSGHFKPSVNQQLVFADLRSQIEAQLAIYTQIKQVQIAQINHRINSLHLPVIITE